MDDIVKVLIFVTDIKRREEVWKTAAKPSSATSRSRRWSRCAH